MILSLLGDYLQAKLTARAAQPTAPVPPADVLDEPWLTTALQVDALPVKAVVMSPDGSVWQRWPNGWYAVCDRRAWTASSLLFGTDVAGPGRVRRIA